MSYKYRFTKTVEEVRSLKTGVDNRRNLFRGWVTNHIKRKTAN